MCIDCVVVSRASLPSVTATGVDSRMHVGINLHVAHSLTWATLHLPANPSTGRVHMKGGPPSRDLLKLPEVREMLQQDIASLPPCDPSWLVDVHDRLLSKAFRVIWQRHAVMQAAPRHEWVTEVVWTKN